MCVSIKDSWMKIFNENTNILWFCHICKTNIEGRSLQGHSESQASLEAAKVEVESVVIMKKEIECLTRELALSSKLCEELDYINKIHKTLLENKDWKKSVKTAAPAMAPCSLEMGSVPSQVTSTARNIRNIRSYSAAVQPDEYPRPVSKVGLASKQNNQNKQQQQVNAAGESSTAMISPSAVKLAVLQAEQTNIMREVQNLNKTNTVPEGEWEEVRTRNRNHPRRFVVGRGESSGTGVQAIPKQVSLHVSRLDPRTKPEDLRQFLIGSFPEVVCYPHESNHPELYGIYTSIKVTINNDNFRKAWSRDIWPNGALVPKFFAKKRRPTETPMEPLNVMSV